jgi:hypothetical protein
MRDAPLAPCVIVHGLAMAQQAVAAARSMSRPVTLLSARGAGAYAGVGWWRALVALACPDGDIAHVLDCGEFPGRALEALRAGQRLLVLRAEDRVWTDVAERTVSCGGILLAEAPTALDLGTPGAERRLEMWLSQAAAEGR